MTRWTSSSQKTAPSSGAGSDAPSKAKSLHFKDIGGGSSSSLLVALLSVALGPALARPVVRHIRSTHEFDWLMKKHTTQIGLPVIADF
ncbi:hypothetical protein ACHAWF_006669 [Thalassiosira exigua]